MAGTPWRRARTRFAHDVALQGGQVHHVQRLLHHLLHLQGSGAGRAHSAGTRGPRRRAELSPSHSRLPCMLPSQPRSNSRGMSARAHRAQPAEARAGQLPPAPHLLAADVLGQAQPGGEHQRLAHRGAGRVHILGGGEGAQLVGEDTKHSG